MLYPLFFNQSSQPGDQGKLILAGDIGGTKTNLAIFQQKDSEMKILYEKTYHSKEYPAFLPLIKDFLQSNPSQKPERICLGVAGPVINGVVDATNLAWELEITKIREETKIDQVAMINDLEATAYGLAGLSSNDLLVVHQGEDIAGNLSVIAPGTGLGEAGLFWDGKIYHPFPTEGGHCDFSPRKEIDIELYKFLREKFGHVSWERLLSGPGIVNIYTFLRDVKRMEEPSWLKEKMLMEDPSASISHAALEENCGLAIETLHLFAGYLALESANLILKHKSTAGLLIGGGIPPKILPFLNDGQVFLSHFIQSGRLRHLLEKVSIKIILNPKTALLGAAWYGAYGI
ncbi:MAG: glucokinase [Chitinophagaceae bacterium]